MLTSVPGPPRRRCCAAAAQGRRRARRRGAASSSTAATAPGTPGWFQFSGTCCVDSTAAEVAALSASEPGLALPRRRVMPRSAPHLPGSGAELTGATGHRWAPRGRQRPRCWRLPPASTELEPARPARAYLTLRGHSRYPVVVLAGPRIPTVPAEGVELISTGGTRATVICAVISAGVALATGLLTACGGAGMMGSDAARRRRRAASRHLAASISSAAATSPSTSAADNQWSSTQTTTCSAG
jgi:hypothetical protein